MKLIFNQLIASHDFILDVRCISPAYIHVYGDRCADVSDEVLQKLQVFRISLIKLFPPNFYEYTVFC